MIQFATVEFSVMVRLKFPYLVSNASVVVRIIKMRCSLRCIDYYSFSSLTERLLFTRAR